MMMDKFSPEALKLWKKVPEWAQEKLLSTVYCGKCVTMTTLVEFNGQVSGGDLVLTGVCKACGSEVARVVESE